MTLQWILGWWNLIFVAPFAVALVYLAAIVLTGVGVGDGDIDADADADVDADADADVDADADADVDADAHAEADADGHDAEANSSESGTSAHALLLGWLGVGRVPLSLIGIMLLLTWGTTGFMANAMLRPAADWTAARISIPVALAASLLITRSVVLIVARVAPMNQNLALRRRDLVGEVGQAVYGIDERFGLAAVRDRHGDLKQVPCRVAEGVATIPRGASVKLVAYRADDQMFFVRQMN